VLADLPAAKAWTNWVGNQSFTPAHSAQPRDEEQVADLVREAARLGSSIRVAGAGHSFTPIVNTDVCCSTYRR
jgi:FAD/FMN-containing dehydrogenase